MKILNDFLNQELEGWPRTGAGHFVGGWAVLSGIATLMLGRVVLRDFFDIDPEPHLFMVTLFLFCAFITIWLFRVAYRLLTDKP